MQLSFEYDRHYWPPFPILEFTVIGAAQNKELAVRGLIDSGSDATQIPLAVLQSIGARKIDDRWVRDAHGLRYPVATYAVQLRLGSLMLYGIEVIGRKGTDEVLVGRDVLNQLVVTLNGLALVSHIAD